MSITHPRQQNELIRQAASLYNRLTVCHAPPALCAKAQARLTRRLNAQKKAVLMARDEIAIFAPVACAKCGRNLPCGCGGAA